MNHSQLHRNLKTRVASVLLVTSKKYQKFFGVALASMFAAGCAQNAPQDTWQPKGPNAKIIDDLQHICRSTATASEFLYTVNAFADLRRRVVIAADRPPQALEGLGADVKSRLGGGLCVGLDKPDRD